MKRFGKIVSELETSRHPWGVWLATFVSLVVVRNLIEGALGPGRVLGFSYFTSPSALMVLDHFLLFYVSVFLAIAAVLAWLARERIGRVMKVMTPAWALLLIPPVLDFIITRGEGARITYVLDLSSVVFRFFDPRATLERVSVGQRVEILAACHLGIAYVRTKTGSWGRAIAAFFAIYAVVALHGILPSAFARLGALVTSHAGAPAALAYRTAFMSGGLVLEESRKLALLFLATSCALGWLVFRMHARAKAGAIARNLRPLRSLHYVGMTAFGIALGWAIFSPSGVSFAGPGDFLGAVGVCVATFLAFQASVLLNDVFDVEGDRLAGERRPLTTGALERRDALLAAFILAGTALLAALNVSYPTFLVVILALAGSLFYSAPPLHLKRFPIVATATLGFVSLMAVMVGFSLFAEERVFSLFPPRLAWLVVLSFALGFTAKDLKDVEGDRAAGVLSLPVLLGPRIGRAAVATLVLLGYLVVPLLLPESGLWRLAIVFGLGSLALVLTWKRPRVDRVLLAVYLAFAAIVAVTVVRDVDRFLGSDTALVEAKAGAILGEGAREREDWPAAAAAYASAVGALGDDPRLLERAGAAHVRAGDFAGGRSPLLQAIAIDPTSPIAIEYLALAELGLGWTAAARNLVATAVSEAVRPGMFLAHLGEIDLAAGDPRLAALQFERALRLGEPETHLRIRLADALLAAGDAPAALAIYEATATNCPSATEARDALGRFYHAEGELDRALVELEAATSLAPDSALSWNNLAVVLLDLGRHAEALNALATAGAIDPRLPAAYYNRARVLDALGRHDEARRQYLLALEVDPAFDPARAALDPGSALRLYQK